MTEKEDLFRQVDNLSIKDKEALVAKLSKSLAENIHDGIAGQVYQDIRRRVGVVVGVERSQQLTPWTSLSKTKRDSFKVALKQAEFDLQRLGMSKFAVNMIPLLVSTYPKLPESVSLLNILDAMSQITALFDHQFPGYSVEAVGMLDQTMSGFDSASEAPSNPLYDDV